MTCSQCHIPSQDIIAESEQAVAVRIPHPLCNGHIVIMPRRHVASWDKTTTDEKLALLALVEQIREDQNQLNGPIAYNVSFDIGAPAGHLHLNLIPREAPSLGGSSSNGALFAPAPLSTGGTADPFIKHLEPLFVSASEISVLAAFVQDSGVYQLQDQLRSCLERGARVRILTGDYLNLTQARALRHLLDLVRGEQIEADEDLGSDRTVEAALSPPLSVRVVEMQGLTRENVGTSFHPKAWIFASPSFGCAYVGSSNMSKAALLNGVEWNLRLDRDQDSSGFMQVLSSYERLWSMGRPLEEEWLEQYAKRARAVERPIPAWEAETEEKQEYAPWPIQEEALQMLRQDRVDEHRDRGLVVLATGLGKTWLAVFDVNQFAEEYEQPPRVLFLAHRVELLRQAANTFRKLFRDQSFGWYVGNQNELAGDMVFASVMKIGRPENLKRIRPDAFDYVIVDEVHHADAKTYRRILNHLEPRFLLGLTATPERADAGDILGLFDDHVAFEADIGVGIASRHLVPFHYFGLKDDIDYKPLWRNSRFDPEELAQAAQTEARMGKLWEAWQEHPGLRTLIFCCSISHARYVAHWMKQRGIRVVAVHSGPDSADRTVSLAQLGDGTLDAVCTVDLFNEGVDIPSVDRVVMLRPTESPVVFIQQLGRGLRTDSTTDKESLTVIDFVGNHRVFLDRVRTLLSLAPGKEPPNVRKFLRDKKALDLSEGCTVDIELEAIDMLRRLSSTGAKQALVMAYRDLRDIRGTRPSLGEMYRMGYNPGSLKNFDGWFDFVASEDDLSREEQAALADAGDWLFDLERKESMTKSFKMVALKVLLDADALQDGMTAEENARRSFRILHRSPELSADLGKDWQLKSLAELDQNAWSRYWAEWPLKRWTGKARKGNRRSWFRLKDGRFEPLFKVQTAYQEVLAVMTREIVDYRMTRYRRTRLAGMPATGEGARAFECKLIHANQRPIIKLPDRDRVPGIPRSNTDVRLPDGSIWRFRFVKLFCNVAHPVGSSTNQLPDLLRRWFGPAAGHPGTDFHIRFAPSPDGWWVEPVTDDGARVIPLPSLGKLTAYPALRAAAGWDTDLQHADGIEPEEVALPGEFDRESCFAVRASGTSMQGWRTEIRDGDWLVMRWSRGAPLGALAGRVALIARGEPEEGQTYHLKRVRQAGRGFELVSDNLEFPPMEAQTDDEPMATLVQTIRPESLGPARDHLLESEELVGNFGLSALPEPPHSRVDGHLFILLEGQQQLSHPDRVPHQVPGRAEAETAYILAHPLPDQPWQYLGVGRWDEQDHAWAIPEVDFATWRAFGQGRSASRRLEDRWLDAASEVIDALLRTPGPGAWIERDNRRCRLVSRSSQSGLRIDGGPDGFRERTISLQDLGWVLKARQYAVATDAHLDEALVNRLRYLDGTPKGSTRWVDTGWALILAATKGEL